MSLLMSLILLQAATATSPSGPATPAPAKEKLVCKSLKVTGSRLDTQRVCATKRQWDVAEQEIQETIRDRQDHGTLTGGSEIMERAPGGPR